MLQRMPAGFIAPCLPTKTDKLPSGSDWLHEIKHDGFRIIARKKGSQVRLYSRPGNDLTRRFPLIVETLARLAVVRCRQQRLLRGLANLGADIRALRCTGRTKRSHGLRELRRETSLEHVKRAVQAPGFVARSFGETYLKVRYGRLNCREDCDCVRWAQVGKFCR